MRVTRLLFRLGPSLRLALATAALASIAPLGNAPAAASGPSILAPADVIVGEGVGHVDLKVTLLNATSSPVSVQYSTADSSALAGSDYVATSGTLIFAPFQTEATVQVQILDDTVSEGFEAFRLNLSSPVNGTIVRSSSQVAIVDNDNVVATPAIVARDAVVDEKDGVALVPVLLGGTAGQASSSTVTVDYTTADGTATAGSDYTTASGTLTFAPGETVKTISVPITDDAVAEGQETFFLDLLNATNATIATGKGVITIGASDGPATSQPAILAPADRIVGEGDGYVDLPVRLSQPATTSVTVHYSTQDSSALGSTTCNSDYVPLAGDLTFGPGETTKVVRVEILDCQNVEGFESFTLNLSSPANGVIARAATRVGIVDNDTVVATPKLVVRDVIVDEKDGVALFPVLLGDTAGQASSSVVTVDYSTVDGSATAGTDYTAQSGTLSFAPGETAKTVAVRITDDTLREPPESFALSLANPVGATIGRGDATATIGASDGAPISQPRISAPFDVGVGEGDGFVDLPVRLSAPGKSPVTVAYTTQDVTATAGSTCNEDYVAATGTLNFAPGETTKVVRVDLLDCPDTEGSETFDFLLSGPVNATLDDPGAAITIADNDGPVSLNSIAVTPTNPAIAGGGDQAFTATGTFSDGHTDDLTSTVTWASSDTAVATVDQTGLAHGVSGGSSTISAVKDGLTGSTNLAVGGLIAQTISFAALPNRTYGDSDFTVSASSTSGLDVSFGASGSCTVSGATVSLTEAGDCTITASQPGDGVYGPAAPVARTFSIAKANQAIDFAPLAAKKVGDSDFPITASSSSGLPVVFSASGSCTVAASATRSRSPLSLLTGQATVHLVGAGSCTITASQPGDGNFAPATPIARTFAIVVPVRSCKVPKVVGRGLAKAKALVVLRHCRVGRVTRGYSRVWRAGIVVAQGRRAGRVIAAGTRVALVVSRGRKR
jgi:chitinase